MAWQIHLDTRLAAGPTLNYAQLKLRQGLPRDEFSLRMISTLDSSWRAGNHILLAFGVSSSQSYPHEFGGNPRHLSHMKRPMLALISTIHHRMHLLPPDGKWNIEFNIDWTDWDTVDALTFQSATPLPAFQLNGAAAYEIGATRYLARGYFVSAGYF